MRVKKTSIIMLFICVWMAIVSTSFSQEKHISLKARKVTLKELCNEIERNSDYRFVFTDDVSAKMNTTVALGITKGSVQEILQILSKKAGVGYNIYGKQIVLFNAPAVETPKEKPPTTQEPPAVKKEFVSLKGKITDTKGEPLSGVSVHIPTSSIGTASDINGNFDLQLPGDEIMIVYFDCIDMKPYEHVFEGKPATINVVLENHDKMLDEVVVIGYGSKDRKSLTSAISSMKNETVERLAHTATSVDNMLSGNIKGVFSSQSSGEPGAAASINIRGKTSMPSWGKNKTNTPLYVIDGMPFFVEDNTLNPLLNLSPNDIESIDVLKDASATAIYGSRGANGVIIVKTKGGRKGDKVNVEAGYTFSVGNPIKEYKPLNIAEYKQLQDMVLKNTFEYLKNRGEEGAISLQEYKHSYGNFGKFEVEKDPATEELYLKKYLGLNEAAFGKNFTNWQHAIRNKNAATHQYNVSIRGGSEFSNYSLSLNATDQEGLLINDRLKRYGSRLAIDTEITHGVQAGGTLNFSYAARKGANTERGQAEDPVWSIRPDAEIYDTNGEFKRFDNSARYDSDVQSANPVAKRQVKSTFETYSLSGNTYLSAVLAKGLSVRADLSVSSHLFKNSFFTPSVALDIDNSEEPRASFLKSDNRSTYTSLNLRAEYSAQFDKHNITAMAGAGADRSFNEEFSIQAYDFSNENILNNIASAKEFMPPIEIRLRSGLNSLYSRFSYDYDSRYLVELSLRADESSKFGPGNRVAVFPAVSLGWRVNKESFLKNAEKVDDLKLRLSLGKTGSTNVEDFTYLQYYAKRRNYGRDLTFGLEDRLPNRDIRWEMTSEMNVGLDFSFFDNRLRGSVDLYRRMTKGVLADAPFVSETGRSSFTSNLVDLSNRGIEFEIGGDVIRTKDFTWETSFNISRNRNRVEKLTGTDLLQEHQDAIIKGYPMGVVKGFRVLKILQEKDMPEVKKLDDAAKEKYGKDENGLYKQAFYQAPDLGPGDLLIADLNGDGRIDEYDREVIANPEPKFFGGWNNTLSYKGFSLSLMIQFSQGGEAVYQDGLSDLAFRMGQSITRETFGRTWTPDNTGASYPRLTAVNRASNYNAAPNKKNVFKTSYFRVRDLMLSYKLSDKITEALSLKNVMIFGSVSNLFTITAWPGIDPELLGSDLFGGSNAEAPYPFARTFSIGARLTF